MKVNKIGSNADDVLCQIDQDLVGSITVDDLYSAFVVNGVKGIRNKITPIVGGADILESDNQNGIDEGAKKSIKLLYQQFLMGQDLESAIKIKEEFKEMKFVDIEKEMAKLYLEDGKAFRKEIVEKLWDGEDLSNDASRNDSSGLCL